MPKRATLVPEGGMQVDGEATESDGEQPMLRRELVRYEADGPKVLITIDRPEAMNALSAAVTEGLVEAFTRFNDDDTALVAILSGAGGRAFSAGADLKEMSVRLQTEAEGRHKPDATFGTHARRPHRSGELRQAGHRRRRWLLPRGWVRVSTELRYTRGNGRLGFRPPGAATQLAGGPRTCPSFPDDSPRGGTTDAVDRLPINAERAYQIGLISGIAEDREALFVMANAIADEILECAPLAVQAIKNVVRQGRDLPVDAQLKYAEAYRNAVASTEDVKEGPKAFAEKRKPVWKMQ